MDAFEYIMMKFPKSTVNSTVVVYCQLTLPSPSNVYELLMSCRILRPASEVTLPSNSVVLFICNLFRELTLSSYRLTLSKHRRTKIVFGLRVTPIRCVKNGRCNIYTSWESGERRKLLLCAVLDSGSIKAGQ